MRPEFGKLLIHCVGLLAVGACGVQETADGPVSPPFTRYDSAGVEVIINARPSRWVDDQGWHVGSVPLLRIGSRQGEPAYEFSDIAGAISLPEGGVAVADAGSGEVRFFDGTGRLERIVGRSGRGPGEFTALSGLGIGLDGRLWAYDFALRRISWIDPHNGSIGSSTLGPEPPVLTSVGALPAGMFVLRQLWGASAVASADRIGIRRDSAVVAVFDSAGTLIDTIGAFPGREVIISLEAGRGVMTRRPFGADLAVVTRDSLVVVGEQDQPRFDEYSAAGELRRRVILPRGDNGALGASDIEDFLEARLREVPAADRPAVRSDLESLPFPESRPAYGRLLVDLAGNVWVGEWTAEGKTERRWSVVDSRGVWLGDVVLPEGLRLLSVATDHLIGVERDELDVESVAVYAIEPGHQVSKPAS
ncbi:MAG: hypothetical protein PVF05_06085 [Gemmatimonadales bacterium]|jgi:hypothetical protein